MNFFETLSRIKSELTHCVEPSVEPVSKDSSIAPLYEEPIDIESWVDLHGVDQKDSKPVKAKTIQKKSVDSDFQQKLREIQFLETSYDSLTVTDKLDSKNGPVGVSVSTIENETLENDDWINDDDSWHSSIDIDSWFSKHSSVKISETPVLQNDSDSFDETPYSDSEGSEILDHIDQFGISRKSVDFQKKRKKGEEGVFKTKGAVEKTIDLHGMPIREAELKILRTFDDSKIRGYQQILIIHGKGNHSSGGESKMKRMVIDLLEGSVSDRVASFTFAPFTEGGGGATRVILK